MIKTLAIQKLQDRKIAKLQLTRQEHCQVASCKRETMLGAKMGTSLSSKMQAKNIPKLEVARAEYCEISVAK